MSSVAGAEQSRINLVARLCERTILGPTARYRMSLPSGEPVQLSLLDENNLAATWGLARKLFAGKSHDDVAKSFAAALVPRARLGVNTPPAANKTKSKIAYWRMLDDVGDVIGLTGLYALNDSQTAWLSWFGMSPGARGEGRGRALLEWTIAHARMLGYTSLRTWTTTTAEHVPINRLLLSLGFERQDFRVMDPKDAKSRIVFYSLSLTGEPVEPYDPTFSTSPIGR